MAKEKTEKTEKVETTVVVKEKDDVKNKTDTGTKTEVKAPVAKSPVEDKKVKDANADFDAKISGKKVEPKKTAVVKKAEEDIPVKGDEEIPPEGEEEDTEKDADDEIEKVKTEIDDDLLEKAVQSGLKLSDARSFPTRASLEKVIELVGNKKAANTDEADEDKPGDEKAKEKKVEEPQFEVKPFEVKFANEEEIDPEILSTLKNLNTHYAEQVKGVNEQHKKVVTELHTQLQDMTDQFAQFQLTNIEKDFDGMIDELGNEFVPLFGKGPVEKGTPEFNHRVKLWDEWATIADGYYKTGKQTTPKALFKKALRAAFGDELSTVETNKVVEEVEKRKKQTINRPAGREGKQLTAKEAAVKASQEFDEKHELE